MDIHEYQAKEILQKKKIPMPEYFVASSIEEVENIVDQNLLDEAVVKIQIHSGGRGKVHGVQIGSSREEIIERSQNLLGKVYVTSQTTSVGLRADKVLISRLVSIEKEYYIGATIDREKGQIVMIFSPFGGMDIEEISNKYPEKILRLSLPFSQKLHGYHLLQVANFMQWENAVAHKGKEIVLALSQTFIEIDATTLEINPLVLTKKKELLALDAKISLDENALFRHPELVKYYDPTQISKMEAIAKEYDLSYIAMEGNIGCMVNGAGLAMATMDIIHHHKGRAANFLDVGGGASREKVSAGFRIILSDPQVRCILINIFGGIMNCEVLADGIVHAASELNIDIPLVVRMEGTHVEKGREILRKANISILTAKDLNEAAKIAVKSAKGI